VVGGNDRLVIHAVAPGLPAIPCTISCQRTKDPTGYMIVAFISGLGAVCASTSPLLKPPFSTTLAVEDGSRIVIREASVDELAHRN
jgi:hypothetical protein